MSRPKKPAPPYVVIDEAAITRAGEKAAAVACVYGLPADQVERKRHAARLHELGRQEDVVHDARAERQRVFELKREHKTIEIAGSSLMDAHIIKKLKLPEFKGLTPRQARALIRDSLCADRDTLRDVFDSKESAVAARLGSRNSAERKKALNALSKKVSHSWNRVHEKVRTILKCEK